MRSRSSTTPSGKKLLRKAYEKLSSLFKFSNKPLGLPFKPQTIPLYSFTRCFINSRSSSQKLIRKVGKKQSPEHIFDNMKQLFKFSDKPCEFPSPPFSLITTI